MFYYTCVVIKIIFFPETFINIDLFLIFIILFDVEVRARLKTLPF